MNVISVEEIQETADRISNFSLEETKLMMRRFKVKQKYLLIYTAATAERDFNDEEEDIFIFLCMTFWRLLSERIPGMRMVSREDLEEMEERNTKELEKWGAYEESAQFVSADAMLRQLEQPHMFGYALDMITESENVRDDFRGLMLLHVRTILDCLLKASKPVN